MKLTIDTTELKNINQACELLHKSRRTMQRWLNDGKILTVQIGGKRFIPDTEIERILKADTNLTRYMIEEK